MFHRRWLALVALGFAASTTSAQFGARLDPDWVESEVPPPPALRTDALIELDTPRSTLRFGVDPASVTIGKDRVVRYVVVARGAGDAVTGIYEGLHCRTGEVKVYARHNTGTGWVPVDQPQWKPLQDPPHAGYSLLVARQAACMGRGPNRSAAEVVRDLKAPANARFTHEKL